MRIMGIDPGTRATGVGIINIGERNRITLCHYDCIKTDQNKALPERLQTIYTGLSERIGEYRPDHVAVEDIFYSENVKTAIILGHARGVALLAPIMYGIEPAEYSPREVKLAVVGKGAASKGQVGFMVQRILGLREEVKPADAADALAVAICHFNRMNLPGGHR